MSLQKKYPVVLRFEGMFPHQIKRYEMHRLRRWKEEHCDPERKHQNRLLIGDEGWADRALAEIQEMRMGNFAAELATLQRNRKTRQAERRMIEGPRDPWRPTKHGPMREVILTANLEWFETGGDSDVLFDTVGQETRQRKFEALAVAWLKETFGDDVIHARADLDETTYHIHAVIMPRAAEETAHATFHKLQPSVHTLINDYEAAQDSVGEWFAPLGLVRGDKRAEKVRKAYAENTPLPPIRRHKRTRAWRGEQERKLASDKAKLEAERKALERRETEAGDRDAAVDAREATVAGREVSLERRQEVVATREAEADAILAMGEEIAVGTFVPESSEPEPEADAASPRRRARGIFSRAIDVLNRRAREKAEADLSEAYAAVGAARNAIHEVVRSLPSMARAALETVQKRMIASFVRLDRVFDKEKIKQGQSAKPQEPEK